MNDDFIPICVPENAAEIRVMYRKQRVRIEELEVALQSIKDDYEFTRYSFLSSEACFDDRSEAYYETACKALTKEE